MIKQIITTTTLLAASVAMANAESTIWSFENTIASDSVSTHTVANPSWSGTSAFEDSGVVAGTTFGSYVIEEALGKSASFTGSNHIKLGDAFWSNQDGKLMIGSGANNSSTFTIMSYVKLSTVTGDIKFFGTGDGNGAGFAFGLKNGNLNATAKNVADHIKDGATVSANTWTHIAFTFDATTKTGTYFVNGDSKGTLTFTSGFTTAGGAGAAIGSGSKDSAQDRFTGLMDDLQIRTGIAMSAEQIRTAAGLVAAIPEPSMFGLLAGLGALALVGARRRRK